MPTTSRPASPPAAPHRVEEVSGLRARKKAQTREHIAATAAGLFGRRGYEQVSVAEVARAADVAEQTVYNYFPTKPDLVLDRFEEVRDRLTRLVAEREPGTTPAAALRPAARQEVENQRSSTRARARGQLPVLCATSPTVRRLTLESRDRQADAVAEAIRRTSDVADPLVAKTQAVALLSVFQWIVDHTGRRLVEGAAPAVIGDELAPIVEAALDDLDRRYR